MLAYVSEGQPVEMLAPPAQSAAELRPKLRQGGLPKIGGLRWAHGLAQKPAARLAFRVAVSKALHVRAPGAQTAQKLVQAELRMLGIELLPALFIQRHVEARQHDSAVGQMRDRFQQIGGCGNGAG